MFLPIDIVIFLFFSPPITIQNKKRKETRSGCTADAYQRFSAKEMTKEKVNAEEILIENGYEGIKYLTDFSYDTALIGVSNDNRAIYDYDLMIEWLIEEQGFTEEEAAEWIDYNTLRALPYMGSDGPLVLHRLIV